MYAYWSISVFLSHYGKKWYVERDLVKCLCSHRKNDYWYDYGVHDVDRYPPNNKNIFRLLPRNDIEIKGIT